MLPYILVFAWSYFFVLIASKKGIYRFWPAVIGSLPLVFLAVFRGNVGTDTAAYIAMFEIFQSNPGAALNVEPGFALLSLSLLDVFKDPRVVLGLLAFLTSAVLFLFARRIGNCYLFSLCLLPMFYQSMVMNGVRFGLSFALIALAIAMYLQGRRKLFFMLALLGGLIHTSGISLALLFYLVENRARYTYLLVAAACIVVLLFADSFVFDKLSNYYDRASPSILSGVSTLVLSLGLICVFFLSAPLRMQYGKKLMFLLGLTIFSFALAKISYAGLRVQALVLFLILMLLQYRITLLNVRLNVRSRVVVASCGLLGLAFNFGNYMAEEPSVASPFLPYHFVWQVPA